MKAKSVNEIQNFERGQDPKKAMDLGYQGYDDYIKKYFEKGGGDPTDFWENYWNNQVNHSQPDAQFDEKMEILKNTPVEYQIMWAKERINWWETEILPHR